MDEMCNNFVYERNTNPVTYFRVYPNWLIVTFHLSRSRKLGIACILCAALVESIGEAARSTYSDAVGARGLGSIRRCTTGTLRNGPLDFSGFRCSDGSGAVAGPPSQAGTGAFVVMFGRSMQDGRTSDVICPGLFAWETGALCANRCGAAKRAVNTPHGAGRYGA